MSLYKIKICKDCGKEFLGHIAKKTCEDCDDKFIEKESFEKICPQCGEAFSTVKTNKKYCSRICRKAFNSAEYYRRKEWYNNQQIEK